MHKERSKRKGNSCRMLLMLSLGMLIAACGATTFEAKPVDITGKVKPCPPEASYTPQEQDAAARELGILRAAVPECVVCRMMDNYHTMRKQCR